MTYIKIQPRGAMELVVDRKEAGRRSLLGRPDSREALCTIFRRRRSDALPSTRRNGVGGVDAESAIRHAVFIVDRRAVEIFGAGRVHVQLDAAHLDDLISFALLQLGSRPTPHQVNL